MNNLCTDISFHSINKYSEELCGDNVELLEQDDFLVMVLADGMGSGVKAHILSKLTAKIISTMLANNLSIEECVNTMAQTLPVNKEVGLAYSTFTIIRIWENREAQIIRYDNPSVILLRDGESIRLQGSAMVIDNKTIYTTKLILKEGDTFITFSDGVLNASMDNRLNFEWDMNAVVGFFEGVYEDDMTANMFTSLLIEECNKRYGYKPGDDATVCTIKLRQRKQVNLLIGPPQDPKDVPIMMSLFFSKEGKHIVCGGTTSELAAEFLGKEVIQETEFEDPEIPPIGRIDGVDLVTEGIITFNRLVSYAKNYIENSEGFENWANQKEGAFMLANILFEEATDINFFVGKASNPAHNLPNLPISYNIKMKLIEELTECLKQMGKRIKVSYF